MIRVHLFFLLKKLKKKKQDTIMVTILVLQLEKMSKTQDPPEVETSL